MITSTQTPRLADWQNSAALDGLSVIIPVGPEENTWRQLLADLIPLPERAEVLIVGTAARPSDFADVVLASNLRCTVQWLHSPPGRAKQLNRGAANATGEFLWFVHADSRLHAAAFDAVAKALARSAEALHYFDLAFQADGPALTRWNARGANFRSRWLGLPFGDQAFCISAALFNRLGGYDELVPYGEDHLLVWKARRAGIALRPVRACVTTSARKYRELGWLRATTRNLWRTARQALPQFLAALIRRQSQTS